MGCFKKNQGIYLQINIDVERIYLFGKEPVWLLPNFLMVYLAL